MYQVYLPYCWIHLLSLFSTFVLFSFPSTPHSHTYTQRPHIHTHRHLLPSFFFLITESCPRTCGYIFYIIPSFLSSSGKTFQLYCFYYLQISKQSVSLFLPFSYIRGSIISILFCGLLCLNSFINTLLTYTVCNQKV